MPAHDSVLINVFCAAVGALFAAVGPASAQPADKFYDCRFDFVPAGGARFDKANGTGKSFFVAARLAEQKGLEHLVRAVHLLLERGLNSFNLEIGGDGPDRQKLLDLAQTLDVGRYIHFLGGLNREQVR